MCFVLPAAHMVKWLENCFVGSVLIELLANNLQWPPGPVANICAYLHCPDLLQRDAV